MGLSVRYIQLSGLWRVITKPIIIHKFEELFFPEAMSISYNLQASSVRNSMLRCCPDHILIFWALTSLMRLKVYKSEARLNVLEKIFNGDCNITASLKAWLQVAVGTCIMLCRNINSSTWDALEVDEAFIAKHSTKISIPRHRDLVFSKTFNLPLQKWKKQTNRTALTHWQLFNAYCVVQIQIHLNFCSTSASKCVCLQWLKVTWILSMKIDTLQMAFKYSLHPPPN